MISVHSTGIFLTSIGGLLKPINSDGICPNCIGLKFYDGFYCFFCFVHWAHSVLVSSLMIQSPQDVKPIVCLGEKLLADDKVTRKLSTKSVKMSVKMSVKISLRCSL